MPACDEREQFVEASRPIRRSGAGNEIDSCEDVPSEDEHTVARAQDRLPYEAEMVGGVLDAIKAIGALHTPTVPARLEDRIRVRRHIVRSGNTSSTNHYAGLALRSVRLMNHASVSGTLTISTAPITVSGDGSRSAWVN